MKTKHANPLPHERLIVANTSKHLSRLVANASFEVLARDIVRRPAILARIDSGTKIYIPFPPNGSWNETIEACRVLNENDCYPIPHLPARRVRDTDELIDWAKTLEGSNVRGVMLIAGDVRGEAVYFKDSVDVLQTKILAEHGIERVGVAVYPDGHPFIPSEDLRDAFSRKLEIASRDGLAMHAVTQFGFDASPVQTWLSEMASSGLRVPVSVGVAGPTRLRTLISYASKCGVAHSAKGLFANPSALRVFGEWDPLQILSPVAECLTSGLDVQVANTHVFTFGSLKKVLQWREELLNTCDAAPESNVHS